MSRRRVLLLLKPFDVYPPRNKPSSSPLSRPLNPQVLRYLNDRCRVHKDTIDFCQDVLQRKHLDWEPILRNNLFQPIRHFDLVITVGGDGTLLRASHFIDDTVPVLGVNSDPTQPEEVDQFNDDFDATRSTGYLCAATASNFEQVLDEILEGHRSPSDLSRISIKLNDQLLSTYALNDILVAHPCPATVSRFSFRMNTKNQNHSLINCRSSGLRTCTPAGSTAAMLSAGGFPVPISSRELQYMVREPISPKAMDIPWMHGLVKHDESVHVAWYSKEGAMYVDGSHVSYSIQHGDVIEISTKAPSLKVYLSQSLLR
ncbi:probable NADH kinase [Asparagus officinalis]|uniref:probable NADH kinase n=1 Tax=Asparagus officinalis TaxID=4686 RepID=UPI00098E4C1F|nr:probable NADH kinase [Asparagus officinalis]